MIQSIPDLLEILRTIHFDLLSTGISIVAILILGILVFQNDPTSITNRTFLLLSITASSWGIINFLSYKITYTETWSLWLTRFVLFFAIWFCYSIFKLMYVFPFSEVILPLWFKRILLPSVSIVSIFVLTPFVFSKIIAVSSDGIPQASISFGIVFFGLTVLLLIIGSWYLLAKRIRAATPIEREKYLPVLFGVVITFSLLIVFNFILPAFFKELQFIPFGGLYILPFVTCTTYAIFRKGLFNVKILATQTFVTIISLLYFAKVLLAQTTSDRIVDGTIFFGTLLFSILLVRSVKQEITAREKISSLANELSETNWQLARSNEQLRIVDQRKSEFVSIVSHQLRTPITAIKGYASLLLEDSYGKLTAEQSGPIEKIFASSKRLADMVSDFLDISKIEQGKMTYTFTSVDLHAMLTDLTDEFRKEAKEKKLKLTFTRPEKTSFIVTADDGKIRQIFSNILDNAIKYTPKGEVTVSLEKDNAQGTVITRVKDSGIGLSQDDIHHLFGKFTRGSGGQKEHTSGSGLGLYVAKKMLEAQHGKIWIDSEGPGKGSTFVVELLAEEEV